MLLPVGSLAVLAAVEPCLTAAALAAGLGTHATLLGHVGCWAGLLSLSRLDLDWTGVGIGWGAVPSEILT